MAVRGDGMAKNVIITVNRKARTVEVSPERIAVEGECKQGHFIVDFADGFIDGSAVLEVLICNCGEKGYITLEKDGETYKGEIAECITQHHGNVKLQVKITQEADADGNTPIYKSVIFTVKVEESINATQELTRTVAR